MWSAVKTLELIITISLGYKYVRKDFVFLAVSEDHRDHSSGSLGKDIPPGKMVGCEQLPLTLSETVHAKWWYKQPKESWGRVAHTHRGFSRVKIRWVIVSTRWEIFPSSINRRPGIQNMLTYVFCWGNNWKYFLIEKETSVFKIYHVFRRLNFLCMEEEV